MKLLHSKNISILFFVINLIFFIILSNFLGIKSEFRINVILIIMMLSFYIFGIYDLKNSYSERTYFFELFIITFLLNSIPFVALSYSNLNSVSSNLVLFSLNFIFQYIVKVVIYFLLADKKKVVIIGNNDKTKFLIKEIKNNFHYKLVGVVTLDVESEDGIHRTVKNLKQILSYKQHNIVVNVLDTQIDDESYRVLLKHNINTMGFYDFYGFVELVSSKIPVNFMSQKDFMDKSSFKVINNTLLIKFKRFYDILLSVFVFICAFPIMIISSIIIKLETPGPLIFKQTRVGIGGVPFTIYKFRSMRIHDENEHPKHVIDNDSRVTRFGGYMRRTRIDELPQLINIIKNDMSFIGPRAEWKVLADSYSNAIPLHAIRHIIKPGLTGWAQVNYPYGENITDEIEKLMYDLYYIKRFSIMLELSIFFTTLKIIIFSKGK